MRNKRKMTMRYLKYVVKSPIIFYIYILCFLILWGWMTNAVSLDSRISYTAFAKKGKILVVSENEIELLDKRIYAYNDKNQAVETLMVSVAEFNDGMMCFVLAQEQEIFTGNITIEVVAEKRTLFDKIFAKADKTR